jgi:hypothetical protein
VTLTGVEFRRHVAFATSNMAEGRALALPAIKRVILVDNGGSAHGLAVRCGATTVPVEAGALQLLHTTGAANGLVAAAPPSLVAGAAPFDIALYCPGQPETGEILLELVIARPVTLPEVLDDSRGHAAVAASAPATLTIFQNDVAAGTVDFAAGNHEPTFALAGGLTLLLADRLTLIAPSPADATLAGLAITLHGYRS